MTTPTPQNMPRVKPGTPAAKKTKPKKQKQGPPPGKDDMKAKEYEAGYKQGEVEGRRSTRTMVLTFLEKEYMAPEVERGTQYGKEILELTAKLSKLLK